MSADPAWDRVLEKVADATARLGKETVKLDRLHDRMVTPKDATKAVETVRGTTTAVAGVMGDLSTQLHSLEGFIKLHPGRRSAGAEASRKAQVAMSRFEDAHTRVTHRIQLLLQARHQTGRRSARAAPSESEGDECDDEETSRLVVQHAVTTHVDVDVYEEIMHARSSEIRDIAENVGVINEIFDHIRVLVHEQGEKLDVVEANVEAAHDHTAAGRSELEKARELQRANRNRSLMCLLVVAIFLAAVVAVMLKK